MSAIRGVNLGGWLVLEPWMTPSLFEGTTAKDEYSYCLQATKEQRARLKEFRDTFITEADFVWLAEHNIQAVRLPVGHWVYGDVKPYMATKRYVDNVFAWAHKHGISVLLDLHGAPGSQNGEMHSGKVGAVGWHESQAHINQTLDVLRRLAKDYGQHDALLGISVLNEPSSSIPQQVLKDFYAKAYAMLRELCHRDAWIVCSDAFQPKRWRRLFSRAEYPGLYFDHHHYQIFGKRDKRLAGRWQLWRTRYTIPRKLHHMTVSHPIIIGEWSAALRSGVRYDRHAYFDAQVAAFEAADAWFYWNYKTEYGGAWSFRDVAGP